MAEDRLIRMTELEQMVGMCKGSIWRHIKEGHFPAAIRIAPKTVAWKMSEIQEWIQSLQ